MDEKKREKEKYIVQNKKGYQEMQTNFEAKLTWLT